MAVRVLVIDDDVRLFELLASYLEPHDIKLTHAAGGQIGLLRLEQDVFDAVLLDVMMPVVDGLQVLRKIREKHRVPVIMLTARGDEADRVVGLELGADDYVAKPFSPRELLARLRAVLRRAQPANADERLQVGGIMVDLGARTVRVAEQDIELTGLEFDLLVALMRRAGRVVPRSALMSEAGRSDVNVSERTIDVHVSHLRRKLGDDPRAPRRIRTIRGVGYLLSRDDA